MLSDPILRACCDRGKSVQLELGTECPAAPGGVTISMLTLETGDQASASATSTLIRGRGMILLSRGGRSLICSIWDSVPQHNGEPIYYQL